MRNVFRLDEVKDAGLRYLSVGRPAVEGERFRVVGESGAVRRAGAGSGAAAPVDKAGRGEPAAPPIAAARIADRG